MNGPTLGPSVESAAGGGGDHGSLSPLPTAALRTAASISFFAFFFFFPLSVLVYPLSTQRAPDFKEKRDFFVLNIQINVAEDY